jgi:hypothetical protein
MLTFSAFAGFEIQNTGRSQASWGGCFLITGT